MRAVVISMSTEDQGDGNGDGEGNDNGNGEDEGGGADDIWQTESGINVRQMRILASCACLTCCSML